MGGSGTDPPWILRGDCIGFGVKNKLYQVGDLEIQNLHITSAQKPVPVTPHGYRIYSDGALSVRFRWGSSMRLVFCGERLGGA